MVSFHRSSHTFIQCMRRVLRKDEKNNKTHGLIIDLEVKHTSQIIHPYISHKNILHQQKYIQSVIMIPLFLIHYNSNNVI